MKTTDLAQLIADQEAKRAVALVTRIADGAQTLVYLDHVCGVLDLSEAQLAQTRRLLRAGKSSALDETDPGLFVRSYVPPSRLLVVGAVHIAQALAPMAALAGFDVTIIDPRTAFASPERFPGVRLDTAWPDEALARIGLDAHSALVALTHDPKLDDPALVAAVQSDAFYIGALGSKRTHAKRLARLAERGLAHAADRIQAPIGLDLGGRAQGEIAVAILAQIIQTKYRGAAT